MASMRTSVDVDAIENPEAWAAAAANECLRVWERCGRRFERRVHACDRVRDAVEDVITLAARRAVPLRRPVLRPLPSAGLSPLELAFNTLDPADRYALSRLSLLAGGRARGEHLASAIARLIAAQAQLVAAQATAAAAEAAPETSAPETRPRRVRAGRR